jgi:predicted HicB family RNase H-like nuclease
MELSDYIGMLRRELSSITRFAGEDVTRTAEMLADALESSVRLTLLEVLSAAAAEITTSLEDTVIEVRLAGGEAEFVVSPSGAEPEAEPAAPGPAESAEDMARITLRLSEPLKARVDAAAAASRVSVNAWLIRAVARALDDPGRGTSTTRRRSGIGQRYTGYARS